MSDSARALTAVWTHDAACQCVPCRKAAYASAQEKVAACTRAYKGLRDEAARPVAMIRARQEWTAARQELVLAEHQLRGAEDRDKVAALAGRTPDDLLWNPGALPW